MTNDGTLALQIQARMQRATLDEPRVGSLPAALAGLAIAIGAMVAISWAGNHSGACLRMLSEVARATATVLEGG